MRISFFKVIERAAKKREDIFVLTGDLGHVLFDRISTHCNEQFYDIGVAEANMIGISAGLALSGKSVYCYSIIPFLVMRAYEQIRIDVNYHNLNVKLVGVGAGLTYGYEGFSHFGLEDLALMRSLHNMTIVVPADPLEAECLAEASIDYAGPLYIRLGKIGDPVIHRGRPDFTIGKALVIEEGRDIAVFATGNMVHTGIRVLELLKAKGIKATLIDMHTIKPLDIGMIEQVASSHDSIFSLEEHNIIGGLGSALAEVLSERRYRGVFRRFGIDNFKLNVGNAVYLRERYGLTAQQIQQRIISAISEA